MIVTKGIKIGHRSPEFDCNQQTFSIIAVHHVVDQLILDEENASHAQRAYQPEKAQYHLRLRMRVCL